MARTTRRKNKKKKSEGIGIHAPTIAVVSLLATVFLSYLYLCGRCDDLGIRIKTLEQEKEALHRRVLNEEYMWSRMKSPGQIRKYLEKHRLDMGWPEESNIVRIPASVRKSFDHDGDGPTLQYADAARERSIRHD